MPRSNADKSTSSEAILWCLMLYSIVSVSCCEEFLRPLGLERAVFIACVFPPLSVFSDPRICERMYSLLCVLHNDNPIMTTIRSVGLEPFRHHGLNPTLDGHGPRAKDADRGVERVNRFLLVTADLGCRP